MFDFIRLQFKLKWGWNKNNSKGNAIMTSVAVLLAVAICLALVWGLSYVLRESLHVEPRQLSVMYITLLLIGLTIFATSMQISRLYRPADLKITARFPLSPFKIFVSNLILNYIDLTIYSAIFLVPMMLVFGWAMGCITASFVFGIILGVIFLPMIPFALSTLLAIPIMYISSLLKKYNVIQLIIFIIFLAGLFTLYYFVLTALAKFFINRNWEQGTLDIWRNLLTQLDKLYNPGYYLSGIIFFHKFWMSFGIIIGATIVLSAIGIVLAKFVYVHIRTKQLDSGDGAIRKTSKLDDYGSGFAILKHTLLDILHTKSYSYFYLGVAIATPVMVFFCDRLVSLVGTASIGSGINFGASILVVSVFMAMISSFSAIVLSIEGKNFYITKLVPVSYRKQMLVKSAINVAVSLGALLISVIVLAALQFISAIEILVLVICEVLFVIGAVFNGANINLSNPNIKPKANGEAEEINVTYMLLIGLVISALFGGLSIIFPKMYMANGAWITYLVIISIALIYALVNFLVFYFTVNKKYRKIEV